MESAHFTEIGEVLVIQVGGRFNYYYNNTSKIQNFIGTIGREYDHIMDKRLYNPDDIFYYSFEKIENINILTLFTIILQDESTLEKDILCYFDIFRQLILYLEQHPEQLYNNHIIQNMYKNYSDNPIKEINKLLHEYFTEKKDILINKINQNIYRSDPNCKLCYNPNFNKELIISTIKEYVSLLLKLIVI